MVIYIYQTVLKRKTLLAMLYREVKKSNHRDQRVYLNTKQ